MQMEETAMNAPYCPDCGCHLEDSDHVFEVWFCPYCDEIVPDPEPTILDDLPEAP